MGTNQDGERREKLRGAVDTDLGAHGSAWKEEKRGHGWYSHQPGGPERFNEHSYGGGQ